MTHQHDQFHNKELMEALFGKDTAADVMTCFAQLLKDSKSKQPYLWTSPEIPPLKAVYGLLQNPLHELGCLFTPVKPCIPVFALEFIHPQFVAFKRKAADPKTTIEVVNELEIAIYEATGTREGRKEMCDAFEQNKRWGKTDL